MTRMTRFKRHHPDFKIKLALVMTLVAIQTFAKEPCLNSVKTNDPTGSQGLLLILKQVPENSPALPKNYRNTSEPIHLEKPLNLNGLDTLNISGSGELSKAEIIYLRKEKFKNRNVTVVDLRQESHIFVNGNSISWYKKYDSENNGKTLKEIESAEECRISSIKALSDLVAYEVISKNKTYDPIRWKTKPVHITPTTVQSEKDILSEQEFSYFRIPAPDYHSPRQEDVDRFITFSKTLPSDQWLHFHCAAGRGRTTTFMTIYDMMKNYDKASATEIIARQSALGGVDLAAESKKTDKIQREFAADRTTFIEKFYRYCKSEGPNSFKLSWTDWLKINP